MSLSFLYLDSQKYRSKEGSGNVLNVYLHARIAHIHRLPAIDICSFEADAIKIRRNVRRGTRSKRKKK